MKDRIRASAANAGKGHVERQAGTQLVRQLGEVPGFLSCQEFEVQSRALASFGCQVFQVRLQERTTPLVERLGLRNEQLIKLADRAGETTLRSIILDPVCGKDGIPQPAKALATNLTVLPPPPQDGETLETV